MSHFRYTIELCPPVDPSHIEGYFEKFKHLLHHTNSFSISSHVSCDGLVAGFYRSYNLAKYLLEREPNISILYHITCHDLNRINIEARLSMLKTIGIKRILVVTGEQYDWQQQYENKKNCCHFMYRDSNELLWHINEKYDQLFDLVAIAGYPQKSDSSIELECYRLFKKSMNGLVGAIYTQCLFGIDNFDLFYDAAKLLLPSVEIVPSVALFDSLRTLKKCNKLTRVKPDESLQSQLNINDSELFCQRYLQLICQRLRSLMRNESSVQINICPFGLFDFAAKLIESLEASS